MEQTVEVSSKHLRFKDAPWFLGGEKKEAIFIGGVGGTGGYMSFLLSRAGFDIIIQDMDIVSKENMAGQFYSHRQIGMTKVEAINNNITNFCEEYPTVICERYTTDSMKHYFMVAAFDNMESRKTMFNNWLEEVENYRNNPDNYPFEPLFVDLRLSAEHMQILCITTDPNRIREYEDTYLFGDNEVEEAVCTFKQTSHAATMIASHAVGFITNHISNQTQSDVVRRVPFYWEYFIPLDFVKTIYEVEPNKE